MNFVCPSCAASNRVPDKAAGITLICRRCRTQVTAPGDPNRKARSWLASPRWLLIVLLELLAIGALAAAVVLRVGGKPPEDIPLVEGADSPQVAVPGGTLRFAWQTEVQAAGGHFQFTTQDVSLVRPGVPPRALAVRSADSPWPDELLSGGNPPAVTPIRIELEVDLPGEYALSGQRVTLRTALGVKYPGRATPDAALTLETAAVQRQDAFVVATEAEGGAFAKWTHDREVLLWVIIGCAVLAAAIPLGAVALAQQRVSIMCPKCGRGCTAVFYHEGGEIYISPCPHRSGRRTEAYD